MITEINLDATMVGMVLIALNDSFDFTMEHKLDYVGGPVKILVRNDVWVNINQISGNFSVDLVEARYLRGNSYANHVCVSVIRQISSLVVMVCTIINEGNYFIYDCCNADDVVAKIWVGNVIGVSKPFSVERIQKDKKVSYKIKDT